MADIKLQAVLEAQDNASGKLKNFEFSLGKVAGAVGIGTIAAQAFSKAVGFVTDTVKGGIKAAQDEEASQARVNSILKTLTGTIDTNRRAVEGASRAAMQFGFDDEDAAESMAKLLQVTGSTTEANTAFQAAMDLARFKQIDLTTATQAMNLAMQGNTRVLKQLGIDVPDNATKLELLGLIHQRVAGQAEAFGNTAAGAQQKFGVALENLQEKIGGAILPVITNFFNVVSGFVSSSKLDDWLNTIARLYREYIAPVISEKVIPAFQSLADAIRPHLPLLGNLAKIIGGTVGLALMGALIVATEGVKIFAKAFDLVLDAVEGVINAIKQVIEWFKKVGSAVSDFKNTAGGTIAAGTSGVIDFFKNLFKAEGGAVSGGQPYIVGEEGTELFVPSSSGTIIPAGKFSMGDVTVNFNNPVVRSDSDLRMLIEEVKRAMNDALRLDQIGAT